jgi:hypothetical protein
MNEKGFQPQFYRKLGYNKSRDVIPQRKRQWDGMVIPQLELKKPNQYPTHAEMMYTYDQQCMKSPYPVSRMDLPGIGKLFGGAVIPPVISPFAPVVITITVSAITETTATSGGVVLYDGGSPVTARGVCWGTAQAPTIANFKTADGAGRGNFSSSLTGLSASTTYYARAYATNIGGTGYGGQVTFTSAAAGTTFYVSAEADSGWWSATQFVANGPIIFGHGSATAGPIAGFVRFIVTIPHGKTIDTCILRMVPFGDLAGDTCNANVYFNNIGNAVVPTSVIEANALSLTSATGWSAIEHWTEGTQYSSPELKAILQAVVDREDFDSGNAVMIVIKDNGSSDNATRAGNEYGNPIPLELYVEWS